MNQVHTPLNKIIIVEDDQDLRESLIKFLKLNGHDITGVASAMEFYQHIASEHYTLAIIDIGLSDQNGLVLAEYLRSNTNMRIIILTARATLEDKLAGYNSGADIYLVKPVDLREVSAAIATLLMRMDEELLAPSPHGDNEAFLPDITTAPWTLLSNEWILLTPKEDKIKLTSMEFNFLTCLISYQKKVVTRKEILKALGYQDDESRSAALEALVHRLRHKTKTNGYDSPIKTTHGIGYCFTADIVTM
ncbi:MAG: response regulator transcription factor [Chlorobiaceae bacterium]|jgi:DNA-binding response OmpR family regulator